MSFKSNHDKIADLAYQAWIDRGQPQGSPEIDWYYALSIVSDIEEIRVDAKNQPAEDQSMAKPKQYTDINTVSNDPSKDVTVVAGVNNERDKSATSISKPTKKSGIKTQR